MPTTGLYFVENLPPFCRVKVVCCFGIWRYFMALLFLTFRRQQFVAASLIYYKRTLKVSRLVIKDNYLHLYSCNTMPPKRKAAAAKAATKVEEPATKVKKGRSKAEEKVEKNEEVPVEKEEQEDVEQKSKSAVTKRKGKQTKEEKQANGKAEATEEVREEDTNGVDEENGEEVEEKSSEKSGGKKGKAKPRGRKAKEVKSQKADEDEKSEKADSEKSEELETANPSGSRKKRAAAEKPIPKDNDDDDEEEEAPKKRQRAAKDKASRKAKEATPEDDDYEEEKPKRGRGKKAQTKDSDKESEGPLNKTETDWNEADFECTKENPKGEKCNLKICSWNVDGLRAWIKKDGLKIFQYAKPDILCLQETKCSEDKHPDEVKNIEGYKQYWCGSEKEGYAGVALFTKIEPLNVKYGIDDEDQDSDGRCITAEYENFYLVVVYVPNAGRGLVTLPKRLEWNKSFMKYVKSLDEKKPVIICGDMNVAHNEIDLANPKTNTKNAGFTKEEREGMTEFLNEGFVDTYRKLYPDKEKAYTFWSYMTKARAKNVGWRLDYFIVSEKIIDNVCDNVINSNVFGSDHCPITLFIHI